MLIFHGSSQKKEKRGVLRNKGGLLTNNRGLFYGGWASPRMGKNIGTRGSNMSFEACERSNFTNSVPFAGLGIAGAVLLKML